MQDRGDAHEAAHLEGLRAAGRSIVEIDKTALSTPDQLREAEAATLVGDAGGRGRHLPGDVLRWALAWARRLPLSDGSTEPRPRCVQLRHRRHEAVTRRQGRGHHPDVRLRRPPRAAPGRQAGDHLCRDGRRRRTSASPGGLRGLLPPRKGAIRGQGAGRFASDRHVPRPGRSLSGLRVVSDVHPATARRRSPVDRGRHASRGYRAIPGRRRPDADGDRHPAKRRRRYRHQFTRAATAQRPGATPTP